MPTEEGEAAPKKTFKDYAPDYLHIDLKELPQMPYVNRKSSLSVAIDRASCWVYFESLSGKTAKGTHDFLNRPARICPFKIEKILTDNGKEFTDGLTAQGEREPTGFHPFDQACKELGAGHRLIPLRHPQTNGKVERFNGRIAELLRCTHFRDANELATVLDHYLKLYNGQIPPRALGHLCPIQALKAWREKKPDRFYFNYT